MKKLSLAALLVIFGLSALKAQDKLVPATIVLEDGSKISCYHFAQKDCGKKEYFAKHITVKGLYEGQPTEIKSYYDIDKLEFLGFNADPVFTGENEQATIIVYKRSGIAVTLDKASINLSCYGLDEKHNQLKVQMQNPLNNQVFDKAIDTKDIQYIQFQ